MNTIIATIGVLSKIFYFIKLLASAEINSVENRRIKMKKKTLKTQAEEAKPKSYKEIRDEFKNFMEESEWQSEFLKEFALEQVNELTNYIREDFKEWELLDNLDEERDQMNMSEINKKFFISKIVPMCYAAEKDRRFLFESFNDFLLHISEE